ncbi:MAG: hypothetical protein RRB13_10310 [bacterium]|nr:hypothetical protein [bacterium]
MLNPHYLGAGYSSQRGENSEDFFRYLYGLNELIAGRTPLWNPYSGHGQPLYFYLLLTSYPSPLDLLLAALIKPVTWLGSLKLMSVGAVIVALFQSLFGLILFKLSRYLVGCSGVEPESGATDPILLMGGSVLLVQFIYQIGDLGANVVFNHLLIFPTLLLYYLLRLLLEPPRLDRLAKVVLASVLMLHYSGSYAVPIGILLALVILFHWVLPTTPAFFPIWCSRWRQIGFKGYLTVFALLGVGLLYLLPHTWVYSQDLPRMVRVNRTLNLLDFRDLAVAQQYGVPNTNIYYATKQFVVPIWLLFLGFSFLGLLTFTHRATRRRFLPLLVALLLGLSVVYAEQSPLLVVVYGYLFPSLQQMLYTNVYVGLSLFWLAIVGLVGFRNFFRTAIGKAEYVVFGFFSFVVILLFHNKFLNAGQALSLWLVADLFYLLKIG